MPRFLLKDLLLAIALIAVGIWWLTMDVHESEWMIPLIGFPFVGAAIFAPFKKPWAGFAYGALVAVLLFVLTTALLAIPD